MKEYISNKWFFIVWILVSIFVLFDMKYSFFKSIPEPFYATKFDSFFTVFALLAWICLSIFAIYKLIKK